MAKQKIETSIEINEIDVVAYPLVESDHVTFENGMSINEMIKGDVVTPVVTHEETSFKVGKGDSDVSSSIVDSSVGEMIIKGQTYQNILPEPSLRNSMSNGKTMQKFNEGYDNVNVVDGVGKSVILKGQTLTNIHKLVRPILEAETPSNYAITKNSVGEISFDVLVSEHKKWRYINAGFLNISLLKPNTKYLVVFEESQNITWVKFMSGNALNAISESGKVQNNRAIVTTLNQITDNRQILYLTFEDGTPNTKVSSKNPMIIEYQDGMENWDIPYFEGMTSVKAPTVKTVGKNLFDKDNFTRDFVVSKTGTLVAQTGDGVTDYIRVLKGKTYNKKGSNSLAIYDIDKKFIKRSDSSVNRYTAESDGYIRWNIDSYNRTDGYANGLNSLQIEEGTTVTTYEPHKSNTLTTPSDLTLRRIGDVYDTLDLVSGEKVERIGEVVLDGSEYWREISWNGLTRPIYRLLLDIHSDIQFNSNHIRCNMFPIGCGAWTDSEHIWIDNYNGLTVHTNRFSSLEEFKSYINNSNLIVQYTVSESIKKVDLSSSGNWEKVVLDGSERWIFHDSNGEYVEFRFANTINNVHASRLGFSNKFPVSGGGRYERIAIANGATYITVKNIKAQSVEQLQSWLSQNPITVWYQTTTSQPNSIKEMLSFSNGHIQLSSKEGSLIPSLDYEVPTNNSYHLDLTKTSTQYTMKNMRGSFTIDNNNYNASANGMFTTPNSMTNKLMITSVVQSNAMLLEGNLTSKTIPYFKGIKSAFDGESKIEILSVGKNLFDKNKIKNTNGVIVTENGIDVDIWYAPTNNPLKLKPNTTYKVSCKVIVTQLPVGTVSDASHRLYLKKENGGIGYIAVYWTDLPSVLNVGDVLNICNNFTTPKNIHDYDELVWYSLHGDTNGKVQITNLQIEESSTPTPYEPYKSNITKIPLSSPLRSLPNGVRDEVILDRENNKVKVIQRVGHSVIDREFAKHGGAWQGNRDSTPCWGFHCNNYIQGEFILNEKNSMNDRLPIKPMTANDTPLLGYYKSNPHITLYKWQASNMDMALNWLNRNPIQLYYQLATPIITEIDLDGYPYVYKDGHIFLNSKIAPTTTMKYSINQSHQIASQNGDLIRHEKEINYLYTLIAKYVNVQYESTLLNLDLELSRA